MPHSTSKMGIGSAIALCLMLVACAAPPPVQRPDFLLQDQAFAAPAERISAEDVFAVSEEMQAFARTEIIGHSLERGRYHALFDALYHKGHLKLDYDSAVTRNAADAFAARSGNCLSLVVMAAAFAKELGIRVQYQSAIQNEPWSRSGSLYLRNGHVNVTLGNGARNNIRSGLESPLLIDFLPPEELSGLRTRPIDENRVVAMFMNNRATEALVAGRLDEAYWWVRAAIDSDPGFNKSYNTLGVIYHRHNDLGHAERAFRYVLAGEQTNTAALANLSHLLNEQGRVAEADALNRKLASIEPDPPFHFFDLGRQAMARGDYRTAQNLFEKEVDRDPYYHEFHFWLAVADLRLGQTERARKELQLAMESSTSRGDRDLYAAKLAWIRAHQ